MTSTLPYDKRGSYSILHNHLRAFEQARLQKIADGNGNESARARMRINNLNLQADAARRVRQDSDVTLVAGATSKPAEHPYDSETEGEDDETREGDKVTKQAITEVKASKEGTIGFEKDAAPGKKEKRGGKRKRMKEKISKVTFATLTGYVPKPKGPEFAIYPI
jgi:hypothetical protein